MIRRPALRATLAVVLAVGTAGVLATAASADAGGCGSAAGWTIVHDVPAGTASVTVTAPAGTGIVETCVWTGVETEVYAYDPAPTSAVIAPLATPTIVEYGYRLIALEPVPTPEPTPEPAPDPTPAPAPAPAPQPAAPAPAPRTVQPSAAPTEPATPAAPDTSEQPVEESTVVAPTSAPVDDECPGTTSRATCARVMVLAGSAPAATTTIGPSASVRGPVSSDPGDAAGARTSALLGALVLLAGGAAVLVARQRPSVTTATA